MLYEKIYYPDDFPIKITIANIEEYPAHYHQDIEFVYVLQGRIRLKNGYCHYLLEEGDIFTNSGHEVHSLSAENGDNTVALIQVSNRFFTRYFPQLTRNCFRTYVNRDPRLQLDRLRQMLLNILHDYLSKSFSYKNQCIFMMIDVIEYLNRYFNLFYFENQVVVNFKEDNPIITQRISRIISYIYENYASKITLETLADKEHLNTFYLSHLISDHIGISFQELLCFARVEMSEVPLLQTEKKISTIAREVGFSATAYYEKYFKKWFGYTPSEHRIRMQSKSLCSNNPARIRHIPNLNAIRLIRRRLSSINSQQSTILTVSRMQSSVIIDSDKLPVLSLNHRLEPTITKQDLDCMGDRLFFILRELQPEKICLTEMPMQNLSSPHSDSGLFPTDALNVLRRLEKEGFSVSTVSESRLDIPPSFGCDSIAAFFHIFKKHFLSDAPIRCRIRDQGDPNVTLKGALSCFTSTMIPKPAYYAYRLLALLKGDLLYWHKHYAVIRMNSSRQPSYALLVFNFSSEIEQLCLRSCSVHEVHDVCSSFIDEYSVDFFLPLIHGNYSVMKFALNEENSIFHHMAELGFPRTLPLQGEWLHLLNTGLQMQGNMETAVDNGLNISFQLRGPSVQLALIQPSE